MLSFSLRRRSAPGSLTVREDGTSPNRPQQRPIPSISSKKSLSSLFSLATKDSSPRTPKPSDQAGLVEEAQYPVNDATNPIHNPETSPSIRLQRSRRRSSSRNRSSSGPSTFLDNLASKMRAATEFFHKGGEGGPRDDQGAVSLPPRRSVSPKKSVRFRSGTYSLEDTRSSPINVPKKSAPTLPQLELPKAPFMNNFGPLDGDPIPTGRPPDTPVLMAKERGDSYFVGAIKPVGFDGYNNSVHPPLPLRTKLVPSAEPTVDHPFDDSATVTRVHARKWSPGMSRSTTAATADSEPSVGKTLADFKSSTANTNRTSETLYEDDQPQVEQVEHALDPHKAPSAADAAPLSPQEQQEQRDEDFAMALFHEEEEQRHRAEYARDRQSGRGSPSKPDGPGRAPVGAEYQPPSAQVSWAVVHAQPSSVRGGKHAKEAAVKQSLWTLASRERQKADSDGYTSPSEDGDVRSSRSVSPRRSQRRQPTHEDIRRRFRSPKAQTPFHWSETASTSTGSAAEREATFVTALEEVLTTDPPKPLPQATPRTSPPEQEVVVPEHALSPLNLKSNVSATSPSRTRRPFRFSNSTDKDSHVSPIGNTSFSLHAKKADETPTPPAGETAQTPSPVSVPLPLSIPPKKWAYSTPKSPFRYANQYGWSPFDEDLFLDVFLRTSYLHPLLLKEGGFYDLWKQADLPLESAPTFDTEALSHEQVSDLVLQTHRFRRVGGQSLNAGTSDAMAKLFSPFVSSSVNKYGPLATYHEDYSGEVSTIDFPSAEASSETGPTFSSVETCSEAGQHVPERSCNMCLTRESYESSDGPSMPSSVSGYDSDVETTASDRENARVVGTLTPSRLSRPVTSDKTPTQTAYARHTVTPLSQRAKKYYRGSELSDATVSADGAVSEDEKFTKGIV